jgi:hypothetical protein
MGAGGPSGSSQEAAGEGEHLKGEVTPKAPFAVRLHTYYRPLLSESDRGCALIGCAYLDNDLEQVLRSKFRESSQSTKRDLDWLLNGPIAPLKSFAVRTRMAHALGLIDSAVRKMLDTAREIRNVFAHTEGIIPIPGPLAQSLFDQVKAFYAAKGQTNEFNKESEEIIEAFRQYMPMTSSDRIALVSGLACARTLLHDQAHAAGHPIQSQSSSSANS